MKCLIFLNYNFKKMNAIESCLKGKFIQNFVYTSGLNYFGIPSNVPEFPGSFGKHAKLKMKLS